MSKKQQPKPQRKQYTAETKQQARKMYLRGLYLSEISILLGVPLRTLEKWQLLEKWTMLKEIDEIKTRAYELQRKGYNLDRIAKTLDISKRTVSRYIKTARDEKTKE